MDGKIDGKIETAHTAWTQETQEKITETETKIRSDLREVIEDDRSKCLNRWDEYNQARKLEIDLLKEEFARSLAAAKGIYLIFFYTGSNILIFKINLQISGNKRELNWRHKSKHCTRNNPSTFKPSTLLLLLKINFWWPLRYYSLFFLI